MVVHEKCHAVARLQACALKLVCQVRTAVGPLRMVGDGLGAVEKCRATGVLAGHALEQMGKVHRILSINS
jgi:hypothetical protein